MRKITLLFVSVLLSLLSVVTFGQSVNTRGIEKKDIRALIVYSDQSIPADQIEQVKNEIERSIDSVATGSKKPDANLQRNSKASDSRFTERLTDYLSSLQPGQRSVIIIRSNFAKGGSSAGNQKPNCESYSCPWKCSSVSCGEGAKLLSCCAECNDNRICCQYSCIKTKPSGTPMYGGRVAANTDQSVELIVIVAKPETTPAEIESLEKVGLESIQKEAFPAGRSVKIKKWLASNF